MLNKLKPPDKEQVEANMGRKVSITTFNCGKVFPYNDRGACKAVIEELIPISQEPQDIYVLGFQELVEIWEGSFPEVVGDVLSIIVDHALRVLELRFPGEPYKLAATSNMGAIAQLIIVNDSLEFENLRTTDCKRGVFYSSLKGCTAIYCNLRETGTSTWETYVFINCHLNANESEINRQMRIDDYNAILDTCKQAFQLQDMLQSHIFFLGDLNFRVMKDCDLVITTNWQDTLATSQLIKEKDELTVLKEKGQIMNGFIEENIMFPPTFKYYVDETNEYNPKRIPSWCDRILYYEYKTNVSPKFTTYNSIQRSKELQFTDHQAVNLTLELPSVSTSNTQITSRQARPQTSSDLISNIIDTTIGYSGWLASKNVHLWFCIVLFLYILYKMFM